jgi:hypothetical protein
MTGMSAGPQRKARWAALAGTLALITGCGSNLACSAVGCASGLSVSGPYVVHQQRVRWVKICIRSSCQTRAATAANGARSGFLGLSTASDLGPHAPATAPVSITLETAGRARLLAAQGSVRFRKSAPNGVKCGPVCYQAQVTVRADGTLTATPAPG